MAILSTLAVLTSLLTAVRSGPVEPYPLLKRQGFSLDGLTDEWKGIYWDEAFETCSDTQLAVIAEATRMAGEIGDFNHKLHYSNNGFDRYFYSTYEDGGWQDGEENLLAFTEMQRNLQQIPKGPREGPKKIRKSARKQKVAYRCKDFSHTKCERYAKNKDGEVIKDSDGNPVIIRPNAFTVDPRRNEEGWAIVFCPPFFNSPKSSRYINDITKEDHAIWEMGDLESFERTILHEWMHADKFGIRPHIEDVMGLLKGHTTERKIYGESSCRDFAKIYKTGGGPGGSVVNIKTARNADSFAWMFVFNWFEDKFKWAYGSMPNPSIPGMPPTYVSGGPQDKRDEIPEEETEVVDYEGGVRDADIVMGKAPDGCHLEKDENGVASLECNDEDDED